MAPDIMSYDTAISACEKLEQWQQELGLLADMRSVKVSLNASSYSAVSSACEQSEQ